GDLNGDGILDVGVLGMPPGALSSLIGQGDGSFTSPNPFAIRYANEAHTLLLGDVRGAGRADFIYVTPNQICVWSRNTREPMCTPTRPRSHLAAIGDFTGDGILDIALVAELTPAPPTGLCVYAGDGQGGFQLTNCTGYQTAVNINLIAVADINGDGK